MTVGLISFKLMLKGQKEATEEAVKEPVTNSFMAYTLGTMLHFLERLVYLYIQIPDYLI